MTTDPAAPVGARPQNWDEEADTYARMVVTPLYRGGETPTPYERGMLRQIKLAFLAGAFTASGGAVPGEPRSPQE